MRNDQALVQSLRQRHEEIVRPEQGRSMANRIGAFECFECSSKTGQGVDEIFRIAAKASIATDNKTKTTDSSKKCILQ